MTQSIWAAITKYHKLGSLNNWNFINSPNSKEWKVQTNESTDSFSGEKSAFYFTDSTILLGGKRDLGLKESIIRTVLQGYALSFILPQENALGY